jgi:glycerophosphoryl diester phosphodiesterase
MTGMLIVGHRGAMAHAPENSLESYVLAEEAGVDEIELDVRLSADDQLFLLHDATLDRVAGDDSARGLGPAAELTMAQLQSAVLDSGRGVVSLAEMYDATSTVIQLEIKAPETVPHLARFFAQRPADAERTVLMSFQEDALRQASELAPQVRRGVIRKDLATADEFPGGWQGLVEHTRAQRLAVGLAGLSNEAAETIRAHGLELHVWPMRSLENMRDAVRLQADGTTSDDPALAMQWLREVRGEQSASGVPNA